MQYQLTEAFWDRLREYPGWSREMDNCIVIAYNYSDLKPPTILKLQKYAVQLNSDYKGKLFQISNKEGFVFVPAGDEFTLESETGTVLMKDFKSRALYFAINKSFSENSENNIANRSFVERELVDQLYEEMKELNFKDDHSLPSPYSELERILIELYDYRKYKEDEDHQKHLPYIVRLASLMIDFIQEYNSHSENKLIDDYTTKLYKLIPEFHYLSKPRTNWNDKCKSISFSELMSSSEAELNQKYL